MRLIGLLHKTFSQASLLIDKRINQALLLAAETLSEHRHLSITALGRTLNSKADVKHNIKRVDRLFGNKSLHTNSLHYYKTMSHLLIGNSQRPKIIIDWSGLTRCGEYHFIRASVPVGGRALPLLDMAVRINDYTTLKTHRKFMNSLQSILPEKCKPIIVTDAGFRCTWFNLVAGMGWDFVGRVRNNTQYKGENTNSWLFVKTLYSDAKTKAAHVLSGLLAKSNPVNCHFYLKKNAHKNRVRKNLKGKRIQCSVSLKHEVRENEPWLIVSSLSPEEYTPENIINIYKTRMQIEESFRDLKNTKNGFSLRHCRSFKLERLNVALLVGAIAMFLLWALGCATKRECQHHNYQANTVRSRNVLSNFTIGWQRIKKKGLKCSQKLFFEAIQEMATCAASY